MHLRQILASFTFISAVLVGDLSAAEAGGFRGRRMGAGTHAVTGARTLGTLPTGARRGAGKMTALETFSSNTQRDTRGDLSRRWGPSRGGGGGGTDQPYLVMGDY